MEKNEKILLMCQLLIDNRGSFGIDERSKKALDIAKDLKQENWEYADKFIESITDFRNGDDEGDGRYFRMSYKNGGYEDIQEIIPYKTYGEYKDYKISERSNEFQEVCLSLMNYPDMRFLEDDYKEWVESDELRKVKSENNELKQSQKVIDNFLSQLIK